MTSDPEFEPRVVEACVTSAAEAQAAEAAGASRVELCINLEVGGLTPPPKLVEAVKASCTLPVSVLVRSRPDFLASPADVAEMVQDIARFAALGADGFVLGILDPRGRIDISALSDLVAAAGSVPVVFHKAFDEVPFPLESLESIARAGVSRVLTSGGAATAWEGRATLRELVDRAEDRITVMAGGRVRADHVRQLVRETGVREIHARASAVADLVTALR